VKVSALSSGCGRSFILLVAPGMRVLTEMTQGSLSDQGAIRASHVIGARR